MIWAQAVWGLFLAGLLGFSFRRAWRWEHGEKPDFMLTEKLGKETYVFTPPTVLFWILLAFLVLLTTMLGVQEGVTRFAGLAGEVLLTLSVYFLLLLALLPLLRRFISARACALLWLVPVFLFWQAHMLIRVMPMPRWTIYIPRRALPIVGAVWFAGFLAVGGYYLLSHLSFRRRVRSAAHPERDAAVLAQWEAEREALDYKRPVALLRASVAAPFSMGQTKRSRWTVLPERVYTPEELSMIFRHELRHLQRCDVNTKVFFCMCNAVCWFNPLTWIATRKAAEDLERSCDEIVTEDMDEDARKRYAQLLLDAAAPVGGCTTCLSAAARTLRYRLKSVVKPQRRGTGTFLLMAAVFCCVMCYGTVAFTDERGSFTELLLPEDTQITQIYRLDQSGGVSYDPDMRWDEGALRAALDGVELEHVSGLRSGVLKSEGIVLVLPGTPNMLYLTRGGATALDTRRISVGDSYVVRSAVDWNAIEAALKLEE